MIEIVSLTIETTPHRLPLGMGLKNGAYMKRSISGLGIVGLNGGVWTSHWGLEIMSEG